MSKRAQNRRIARLKKKHPWSWDAIKGRACQMPVPPPLRYEHPLGNRAPPRYMGDHFKKNL